ncbi:MAG: S8 family peptidase [Bacteroidia bacterium]
MKHLYSLALFLLLAQSASFGQSKWTAGSQLLFENEKQRSSFDLLVEVDLLLADDFFRDQGLVAGSKIGSIWTTKASREQIENMLVSPAIRRMEISRVVFPQFKVDDVSRIATKVHLVQNNPLGWGISAPYTGKDVIVGIIDIGFQPDHPTFYDTSGQVNRVKRYWDQLDETGNPPAGFNYGSLHSTLADMLVTVDKEEIHGSHVAGIAGGSGFGSKNRMYAGMAYESDLVFVNIRYYDNQFPSSAKGDYLVASPAIIDGLNYIFSYADSVGKPAVVNLSWGMHTGPHDGSSLFDLAIENLTGKGKIFVGAAGNSNWTRTHIRATLMQDTLRTFPFNNRNVRDDVEDMYIDMWGSAGTDFEISFGLADTSGNRLGQSPYFNTRKDTLIQGMITVLNDSFGFDTLEYSLSVISRYAANNKPNILFELKNYTPKTRRTTLFVYADSSDVHAWNSGQILSWGEGGFAAAFWGHNNVPGFTSGNSDFVVGENGGTGKQTISVGAYNSSVNMTAIDGTPIFGGWGNRSPFSSRGPTVDGRTKPDISAPGENVISAFNRHASTSFLMSDVLDTFVWNGQTQFWGAASGTSMASPNATGIIALFLQANDSLDPDMVLDVLQNTAIVDPETGLVPNNDWGYGKIDAYEGLRYILNSVGLREIEPETWKLFPNPSQGNIHIWGSAPDAAFRVYDLQGKMLSSGHLADNQTHLDLSPGLYILVVEEQGWQKSFRLQVVGK